MPEESDSWLEILGVSFESFNDDSSASDVAGVSSGDATDSAPGFATEVFDAGQTLQTDVGDGRDASPAFTLVMDDPIGVLQLISSSQIDSSGLKFNVTVVSSEKDALLVAASVSGQLFTTVKISQPGGTITLQNVVISALSASGAGSEITMTLESLPPRRKPSRPASSTLVMDDPIGVLPLISSAQAGSTGRVFNVVVRSSAKDVLLFGASVSNQSFSTVKISQPSGTIILQNVIISALSTSGPGADIAMTLNAGRPAEINSE